MGFMGIKHWSESDNTSDLGYDFEDKFKGHFSNKAVNAFVEKNMMNESSEYNTPGFIDVTLLMEDGKIPISYVNKSTLKKLDKMLDSWGDVPDFEDDIIRMKGYIRRHLGRMKNVADRRKKERL